MTPNRKVALQWFHDQGEIACLEAHNRDDAPDTTFILRMLTDRQLQATEHGFGTSKEMRFSLTDAGRLALHEGD